MDVDRSAGSGSCRPGERSESSRRLDHMELKKIAVITTTCGDRGQADHIVAHVVGKRMAACGQVDMGIESCFHWKGQMARESEVRCTFKTSEQLAELCSACILEAHPYETPELTIATVLTSPAYADWITDTVVVDQT
jgi:periplasmic divalent cation tolerance protein